MSHADDLRERGWMIATEDELGYPGLHKAIAEAFFTEAALPPRPDVEGPVPTRYRNKDFMHYRRIGQAIGLVETSADRYARIRIPGNPPWRPIPGSGGPPSPAPPRSPPRSSTWSPTRTATRRGRSACTASGRSPRSSPNPTRT